MKITKRQLKKIIREEKQRLLNEMTPADMGMAAARMDDQRRGAVKKGGRASGPYRHPKTGENMFLMLNDIVDKLMDAGIDYVELANELRGLADDVEDSAPQG